MQIHVSFLFIVFLGAVAISTANPLEQHERCANDELEKSNEFPTPKPFLDEPESDTESEMQDQNIVYIPPNFDINQIKEITGIKSDAHSKIGHYVGRSECECGRPGERRIVGGEPAKINEYPWTVALLRKNWLGIVSITAFCGGTLINDRYVVTASHCVDGMNAGGIVVSLHEEDQFSTSETSAGSQKLTVEKITKHPNYNRRNIDNDIALLKLATPVPLGNVFVPACLPAGNNFTFEGENATAAGWGTTSEGGAVSGVLRKVTVPVMSNSDCNTKTNYQGKITDNMLCAGNLEEGGKDSCQGDSGGPLTIENGGRRTLIGVVSWGYGCAKPKSPGVYTRVGRFPEWVLQNTQGAEWCRL
ncbi:trypsin-1 [Folsomia candida]|uniref:trypsin-1 n=1 Tax=Folsomia candida TaxID=158441 RepID=UPI000B8F89A0|nr:trypsin-1 [Folsomia candida]